MPTTPRTALGLLLLLAVVIALPPAVASSPGADPLFPLAWLAGCWVAVGGEPGSGEEWTAPAGGTMLGVSRTVRGGRTVAHEFLQIRETAPGELAFVALPSGQAEAAFPLLRLGPQEAVFENPAHDFPQRVIYRLDAEGVLRARIEGTRDGRTEAVDFPMRHASCDGLAAAARP